MLPPVGEGPQSKGNRNAPTFSSEILWQTLPGQKSWGQFGFDTQGLRLLFCACPAKNLPENVTSAARAALLDLV